MERYSEYKESGVQWIGEIPSHWKLYALKYILQEKKESVGCFSYKYDLLSLTLKGIIKRNMDNPAGKFPSSFDTYKIVHKNDFVFCNFDNEETPRAVGLSNYKGMITGAYDVFSCKRNDVSNRFLLYLFLSIDNIKQFKPLYKGLRKTIPLDSFMSYKIAIPPLLEQQSIADYLDKVTSKIDEAIAQQQKMIDLLNERKQIIINNAVTKGLNPDVPMKYSGVDWIGEIPEHWTTIRLGYCAWIRARLGWKGLKSDEYVDNGYPFLSAFNIVNNKLDWNKLNYINKFRYEESPEIKLRIGDILLVKDGAGIGKCARVDSLPLGEATANGSLAFITANERVYYKFLHYYIISNSFNKYKDLLITGMGVPHLTQGEIKNMMLPIPPLNEQYIIVQRLDQNINVIDNILEHYLQQITFLQERKRIIINDVVTGKVKVS